jgi:hypothetical protein
MTSLFARHHREREAPARRRAPLVAAVVSGALLLPFLVATPAYADDYPTWDEVQAAKANAAATQTELDKIDALVSQLQQASQQAAADELAKAAAATAAKNAFDAASARAASLTQQAADAKTESEKASKQFGQLAVQLYTSGGSNLTARLLLRSGDDGDLLHKLGAVSQLTGRASQLHDQAVQKQNLASTLTAQADEAEKIRQRLDADAQQKLQAAQAAREATDAELAKQESASKTLYAQAATLRNTAASTEASYYEGQAVKNSHNGGGGSDAYIDTSGVVVDPAAAQAYARQAIGSYGWGGDQFGCLVDLWNMESGWRANAYNTSSGAYGIPQAWPADKLANAGADWRTNANTQINWGLSYISSAYGSPCAAWNFEMSHDPHWY